MDGQWPYSCRFVGCFFQNLFHITRSIFVQLPSSFFSVRLVSVQVVHPYSSMNTTAALKKLHWHRLLWHCCRCAKRGHISAIPVYNLPGLRTSDVVRFNEKIWLQYTLRAPTHSIGLTRYFRQNLLTSKRKFNQFKKKYNWNILEQNSLHLNLKIRKWQFYRSLHNNDPLVIFFQRNCYDVMKEI